MLRVKTSEKAIINQRRYRIGPCLTDELNVSAGLMHLCHDGDTSKIEPLEPGTVETYALSLTGKISFESKVRFQTVGNPPIYTTLATPEGRALI